jgi:hypothetical protein
MALFSGKTLIYFRFHPIKFLCPFLYYEKTFLHTFLYIFLFLIKESNSHTFYTKYKSRKEKLQ